jgi:hypothetical protein
MKKNKELPMHLHPKRWQDVWGNDKAVHILQQNLRDREFHCAYFISGPSGTGKTTIAELFVKTLKCENPIEDDGVINPCGECRSCKVDYKKVRSQEVYWIQRHKETCAGDTATYNSQFREAIQLVSDSRLPINGIQDYRVVVIEELWTVGMNITSGFLPLLELTDFFKKNKVIFLFITMSENRIFAKDPDFARALIDRCCYLKLLPKPSRLITEYIIHNMPNCPYPAALEIAKQCNGSLRQAIRIYERVEGMYGVVTIDNVLSTLYLVGLPIRISFWDLLQRGSGYVTIRELKDFWDEVLTLTEESNILYQLNEDIDTALMSFEHYDIDIDSLYTMQKQIISYLSNPSPVVKGWDIIKQFVGLKLLDTQVLLNGENVEPYGDLLKP